MCDVWQVAIRSDRSSKSVTSKYDLFKMCGSTLGGGASSMLLPSGNTAGLMVETILSTDWMISYLVVSSSSGDIHVSSFSTSGAFGR